MVKEDYLSTAFRALNKVEGLDQDIRDLKELNHKKQLQVQKVENENKKMLKEMFIEQSKTREETRKRKEAEEEVAPLKAERDAKLYIIEQLNEKLKAKEDLKIDLDLEMKRINSVNLQLREEIRVQKAKEDSHVDGSC